MKLIILAKVTQQPGGSSTCFFSANKKTGQ